jgi:hypothetical protein
MIAKSQTLTLLTALLLFPLAMLHAAASTLLPPWTPVEVREQNVAVWGRLFRFGTGPLPEQIESQGQPLLADGKIFLLVNNGSKISMLKPSPEKRLQLAQARVAGMWVPSPAIAAGKLLVRGRKTITCYSLTPPAQ